MKPLLYKCLCLFIGSFLLTNTAFAGGGAGNGADAIYCEADGEAYPYTGWYMLDYVVMEDGEKWYKNSYAPTEIERADSAIAYPGELLRQRLEYLEMFLDMIPKNYTNDPASPDLDRIFIRKEALGSFNAYVLNYNKSRNWVPAPANLELSDINDELLKDGDIPPNCDENQLRQAVKKIKNTDEGSSMYSTLHIYDSGLADEWEEYYNFQLPQFMKNNHRLLQLHIRNVHEMLREYFDDARYVRFWTRIIFSEEFAGLRNDYFEKSTFDSNAEAFLRIFEKMVSTNENLNEKLLPIDDTIIQYIRKNISLHKMILSHEKRPHNYMIHAYLGNDNLAYTLAKPIVRGIEFLKRELDKPELFCLNDELKKRFRYIEANIRRIEIHNQAYRPAFDTVLGRVDPGKMNLTKFSPPCKFKNKKSYLTCVDKKVSELYVETQKLKARVIALKQAPTCANSEED